MTIPGHAHILSAGGAKRSGSGGVVTRSDTPQQQNKSSSYTGVTGTEHSTCLSAGGQGPKSQSQHTDMAASLGLPMVALLRCGMSSRGHPHPSLLAR